MTKVLFLHGFGSNGSSCKAGVLRGHFDVVSPNLPFPGKNPLSWVTWSLNAARDREAARAKAQSLVESFQPDVICGSSMGGALAAVLESDAARVLVAPALGVPLMYPMPRRLPARTIILHSPHDGMVSQKNSRRFLSVHAPRDAAEESVVEVIRERLVALGYDQSVPRLVSIGKDHSCNEPHESDTWNTDPHPHQAMVRAVRIVAAIPS
jgi:pimeloyl-ACP methyl ester carboxylesterase